MYQPHPPSRPRDEGGYPQAEQQRAAEAAGLLARLMMRAMRC